MTAFATPADRQLAMLLTLRWLPRVVFAFEAAVREAGLEIVARAQAADADGTTIPILIARGRAVTLRMALRGLFDEWLLADRDARPGAVDTPLIDDNYGAEKLAGLLAGRTAVLRELACAATAAEARERVLGLPPEFDWIALDEA